MEYNGQKPTYSIFYKTGGVFTTNPLCLKSVEVFSKDRRKTLFAIIKNRCLATTIQK